MSTEPEKAVSAGTKAASAVGVLAAVGLAVVANLVVARTYKRWDWTSAGLYTLSEPTKATLRELKEPVEINVLLSASDPSLVSVRNLLEQYRALSDKLVVVYLDPDRAPQAFKAFQQKHDISAGRTEDGRVVTDAQVVIVRGEKKWFLTSTDLVDASESDEKRSRPRLEQGLTTGIRSVLGAEKTRVCFARGHGELPAEEPGRGVTELRWRLVKNNVEVRSVELGRGAPPPDPWQGCDLVVVAGPDRPWPEKDAEALSAYVDRGGNAFLMLGPILDPELKKPVPTGLEEVAKKAGIELRDDLVIERSKAQRLPEVEPTIFFGEPKRHEITAGLVEGHAEDVHLLFAGTRSLAKHPASTVPAAELVTTSKEAFSIRSFPVKELPGSPGDGDREGPFAVAMAAELPKVKDSKASHGARVVVIGTTSIATSQNWREPGLRAGAYFVESAVGWAAARAPIVDIPDKPAAPAAMRLNEASYKSVRNYVVIYIPLALGFIAASVFLRRASTEKRTDQKGRTKR